MFLTLTVSNVSTKPGHISENVTQMCRYVLVCVCVDLFMHVSVLAENRCGEWTIFSCMSLFKVLTEEREALGDRQQSQGKAFGWERGTLLWGTVLVEQAQSCRVTSDPPPL